MTEINNRNLDVIQKVITQCCEIKSDIVSEDENEDELRMILNFGHTIGHAIESFTNMKNYYMVKQFLWNEVRIVFIK